MATTFVWDNDYDNVEQVRPYLKDFAKVCEELRAQGHYPYNDSFKGRIPGLVDSDHEDTGIYLLQTMRRLDSQAAKAGEFLATGGAPLDEFDLDNTVARGTLVRHGWYAGGTGWEQMTDMRVTVTGGRVHLKAPGQRAWRTHYASPAQYLFRPDDAASNGREV